jgi:hypothetical protein
MLALTHHGNISESDHPIVILVVIEHLEQTLNVYLVARSQLIQPHLGDPSGSLPKAVAQVFIRPALFDDAKLLSHLPLVLFAVADLVLAEERIIASRGLCVARTRPVEFRIHAHHGRFVFLLIHQKPLPFPHSAVWS